MTQSIILHHIHHHCPIHFIPAMNFELHFKTNANTDDISAYNDELMQQMMDVPGFKKKVFDQNIKINNDHHTGTIKLTLIQSHTPSDAVMNILQNEKRVSRVSLDS